MDARRSPARDRTLLDRPRPACELESLRGRGGSGGTIIGGGRCEGPAPGELVPSAILVPEPELEFGPERSLVADADWARALSDAAARRRVRSGFLGGSAGGGGSFNAESMSRERGWLCCHTKQASTKSNLNSRLLTFSDLLPYSARVYYPTAPLNLGSCRPIGQRPTQRSPYLRFPRVRCLPAAPRARIIHAIAACPVMKTLEYARMARDCTP